jgi:predicted ATP-grasp superfamily ATP-dependent carboligase
VAFIDKLAAIVRERPHDVLLPGTDTSVLAVSRHRDRLARHVCLGLPRHEIVEHSVNRERLLQEAAKAGLASPEARVCECVDDAHAAAHAFGYPVLIKPVEVIIEAGGAAHRRASVLARGAPGLGAAAEEFGRCIVQRCVRGDVVSFGGVATGEGLLGFAVSRYLRTGPPDAGNVCFSRTIPPPRGLAEKVETLVAGMGWKGLFELIERPDGELAAIDFNPRVYGSLSLAVAAGVPLPALWCSWVLRQSPARALASVGVRYRMGGRRLQAAAVAAAPWRLALGHRGGTASTRRHARLLSTP